MTEWVWSTLIVLGIIAGIIVGFVAFIMLFGFLIVCVQSAPLWLQKILKVMEAVFLWGVAIAFTAIAIVASVHQVHAVLFK